MFTNAPPREGDASPWGKIDYVTPLGPEAVSVTTPSHGGIWVTPAALAKIPEPLRATAYSGGGWFEEDCDWCIPYLALGLHRFDGPQDRQDRMLAAAQRTLQAYHTAGAALLDPRGSSAAQREEAIHD